MSGERFKPVANCDGSPYGVRWYCPGCERRHVVPTTGPNAWGFNGDMACPTLAPSILVYPRKHMNADGTIVDLPRCHTFIREGRIEFLGDCTHALAGKTVDVPLVDGPETP